MMYTRDLAQLASPFRDRDVLTVYLRATVDNPADRRMWEVELDHALEPLRAELADGAHAERAAFDGAVERLRSWILAERDMLRAPGVVVVLDANAVLLATSTETSMPTTARWGRGMYLAPLLPEVSAGPPSAVLVVDTRHTRLYRLTPPRRLEPIESAAASAHVDAERRMGSAVGNFHAGTRGGTMTDDAERAQALERDRLFAEALDQAIKVSGDAGWLVIGGTTRAVSAATALVPSTSQGRVIALERLDVHAGDHEVAAAAAEAIAARGAARDGAVVREILEEHGARGRGVAGLLATRAMLDRAGVAELVLSERFVAARARDADELLAQALGQGATVRQVHGAAAADLDARAEGVAARLRYVPAAAPVAAGG